MKKISICVPVLNEEENIENVYNKILELFTNLLINYDYELIFTDNHSTDATEKKILSICNIDKKVKYIRFQTNLHYDKSILEGYKHSTGDAAVVIDSDLQDPPELIKELIEKWEQGYDLVYGIRTKRLEGMIISKVRNIYYKIINLNSSISYPLDAGGFRLIDRSIINKVLNIKNLYPYVRGITFSLSKKSTGIEYHRNARSKGQSKLGIYNTITYALNALFEETVLFSKIFRRLSIVFTFLFCVFTFFNLIFSFKFLTIFFNIILLILILSFLGISLMLEYLTRIYFHLKQNNEIEIYEKKINL